MTSLDWWISTSSIEDGEFYMRDVATDDVEKYGVPIIREVVGVDDLIDDMRDWLD